MLSQHRWLDNSALAPCVEEKAVEGKATPETLERIFSWLSQQLCQQLCCSTNHMANPDHLSAYRAPCPPGALSLPARGTKSPSAHWRLPAAPPASPEPLVRHSGRLGKGNCRKGALKSVLDEAGFVELSLRGLGGREQCLNLCVSWSLGAVLACTTCGSVPVPLVPFGLQGLQMQG